MSDENGVIQPLPMSNDALARYRNPDRDPRGPWKSDPATAQAGHGTKAQFYVLTAPNGKRHELPSGRCWAYTEDVMQEAIRDNRIWFGQDGNGVPRIKTYLHTKDRGLTPESIWFARDVSTNESAKNDLKAMFDGVAVFETPKPVALVQRMLDLSAPDGIVLDFFAGSGVTAEAVLALNEKDGGTRRFILIQLPEPTINRDYPNITDITKERVRRAIRRLAANDDKQMHISGNGKSDRGFRVFKLAESNFRPWVAGQAADTPALEKQLGLHVEHLRPNRTTLDTLYEILLKDGFPMTTTVEPLTLEGKTVFSVAGGALLVCLEQELTMELVRAIAGRKPERVVCLDAGFAGRDEIKANAVQIFRSKDVKKFKTV
jgi:adenine-specific DNA-methyltransferase